MHRYLWLCFLSLFALGMMVGCGPEKEETSSVDLPADSTEVAETEGAQPCAEPDRICPDGLSFVALGQYVANVGPQELFEAGRIRDTLQSGNGYVWLTRILQFDEGAILVEGDFIDDRELTQDKVDASQVNRIQVQTPAYSTAQGLRVGSTFADLQAAFPDSTLYLDPIPEYQAVAVQVQGLPLFFNFVEKTPELSAQADRSLSPEMMPADLEISSIVVM